MAAEALHVRWPEKYAFDRFATRSERDHQRLTMMNRSRRESGLEEAALPPMRTKVSSGKERTIVAMEWDENSFAADANLSRRVEAWKGKPINVEAMISEVTSYAKKPLAGTRGLRVTMESDGDSTGVLVRLRLVAGKPQEDSSGNFRMIVYARKAPLLNNGGEDWASFRGAITRVLQMPASNAFVVWTEVMFRE